MCWDFGKNKWVDNIPLVHKDNIPLDILQERKLIEIIPVLPGDGEYLLWFIYEDTIITYDCISSKWVSSLEGNPYYLDNFDIKSLFPENNYCIYSEYNKEDNILLFLDNEGNVASYNTGTGYYTTSEGITNNPGDDSGGIYINSIINNNIIRNIKKIIVINGYGNLEPTNYKRLYIIFNSNQCQIFEYDNGIGINVVVNLSFIEDESIIVDIVCYNDSSKFYILFDSQKIIEYSMYTKNTFVVQEKNTSSPRLLLGSKSLLNAGDYTVFASEDNIVRLIHEYHDRKKRISALPIPIKKYIPKGAKIKSYKEVIIQDSSISLFSHIYNSVVNLNRSADGLAVSG
jgi:hypothetical protein